MQMTQQYLVGELSLILGELPQPLLLLGPLSVAFSRRRDPALDYLRPLAGEAQSPKKECRHSSPCFQLT